MSSSKWHDCFASRCLGRRMRTWQMTAAVSAASCPTALCALCSLHQWFLYLSLSQTAYYLSQPAVEFGDQRSFPLWGCALDRVVSGLSAVLWISIPATASLVSPQRTNERTILSTTFMFQQFNPSIRSTLYWVTFPFINW